MLVNDILLNVEKKLLKNDKGVVIITHGLAENIRRYDELVTKLNQNNYSTIAYDIRGHGKSLGARGSVKNYKDFLDDLDALVETAKEHNSKVFILGHSMGGLISHLYVSKNGSKLSGAIISSAPTSISKRYRKLQYIWRFISLKQVKMNFSDPNLVRGGNSLEIINDPYNLKYVKVKLAGELIFKGINDLNKHICSYQLPVLMLHGSDDKIVPMIEARKFYDLIPSFDKKFIIYENAYHEIFREKDKEKTFNDVVFWLNNRM